MKKLVVACTLVSGLICSAFANDARVITMGNNEAFFLDLVSIYKNPANLNLFPNMLLGSPGTFNMTNADTGSSLAALKKINRDPIQPNFGGILSYSLNKSAETGNQYPMISFGAVFNRYDEMLSYITKANPADTSVHLADPLGKIDAMAAFTFANGLTVGLGTYAAFQNVDLPSYGASSKSSLNKINAGVNFPVTNTVNLEGSIGVDILTAIATNRSIDASSLNDTIANNNIGFNADLRLFSALSSLNGDLVPHLAIKTVSLKKYTYNKMELNGGLGLNLNIDKGFFWTGLEGLYERADSSSTISSGYGIRISGGVERNVFWDWFVMRVGFNKKLMYMTQNTLGYWMENAEADGSDGDQITFGVGINIDNRLRFDGVVAEDVVYTFSNLISAPQHHLMNRICATYSF